MRQMAGGKPLGMESVTRPANGPNTSGLLIRSPPYDGRLCPFQGRFHGSVNRFRLATGPFWLTRIDLRRPPMGRAGALTLPAPLRYSLRFVDRASGRVRPMPQARLGLGHPGDRPLAAPVSDHA